MLGNLSEKLLEMVENSSTEVKRQFGMLLDIYSSDSEHINADYFDSPVLNNYYDKNKRRKYVAGAEDTYCLDRQKFDFKMMEGLAKRVSNGADFCHSGHDMVFTTPLGYYVAKTMYLQRAVKDEVYSSDLEADMKKASELIREMYKQYKDEITLFYGPREETLNSINKVLENVALGIKRSLEGWDSSGKSHETMRSIITSLENIYNVEYSSRRDAFETGKDSRVGKGLSEFGKKISKIYGDIIANEAISPYIEEVYPHLTQLLRS
jgi:hypothetical protein